MDAILVPGGFGKRGVEGKIAAIRYARENGIPYLGICLGMQLAVIEYARHVARPRRRATAPSSIRATPHPVIALITEWQDRDGTIEQRDANSDLGGTMRLGAQACDVVPGSLAHRIYGATTVVRAPPPSLRSQQPLPAAARGRRACVVSAGKIDATSDLCEMIELPDHPWFVGCQFHPEFTSTPRRGHPLFIGFVARRAASSTGARARSAAHG